MAHDPEAPDANAPDSDNGEAKSEETMTFGIGFRGGMGGGQSFHFSASYIATASLSDDLDITHGHFHVGLVKNDIKDTTLTKGTPSSPFVGSTTGANPNGRYTGDYSVVLLYFEKDSKYYVTGTGATTWMNKHLRSISAAQIYCTNTFELEFKAKGTDPVFTVSGTYIATKQWVQLFGVTIVNDKGNVKLNLNDIKTYSGNLKGKDPKYEFTLKYAANGDAYELEANCTKPENMVNPTYTLTVS